MPPALIALLVYLLVVRNRVTVKELRSHVKWQLTTLGVMAVFVLIAIVLFVVAGSGVNTDAPISIIATFILVGVLTLFPLLLLYRFAWGTIRFSKQLPMEKLLP